MSEKLLILDEINTGLEVFATSVLDIRNIKIKKDLGTSK
ncbi:hypothetical protein IGI50_002113 [Enterococcus sp. DIV0170]